MLKKRERDWIKYVASYGKRYMKVGIKMFRSNIWSRREWQNRKLEMQETGVREEQ